MLLVLDREILQNIMSVTCSVLQNNFYYSEEVLNRFVDTLADVLGDEMEALDEWIDHEFKMTMKYDKMARKEFTCYFVSAHLHDVMVYDFNFSDQELDAFENILPKYTGVADDTKQRSQRTNYREFLS
jgi:hypothetical protein